MLEKEGLFNDKLFINDCDKTPYTPIYIYIYDKRERHVNVTKITVQHRHAMIQN